MIIQAFQDSALTANKMDMAGVMLLTRDFIHDDPPQRGNPPNDIFTCEELKGAVKGNLVKRVTLAQTIENVFGRQGPR